MVSAHTHCTTSVFIQGKSMRRNLLFVPTIFGSCSDGLQRSLLGPGFLVWALLALLLIWGPLGLRCALSRTASSLLLTQPIQLRPPACIAEHHHHHHHRRHHHHVQQAVNQSHRTQACAVMRGARAAATPCRCNLRTAQHKLTHDDSCRPLQLGRSCAVAFRSVRCFVCGCSLVQPRLCTRRRGGCGDRRQNLRNLALQLLDLLQISLQIPRAGGT
eukprot:2713001-Rhodomonas_salina.2